MIRLAFYFAVGALLHLLFVGSHFDFNNAWTWLWLFGWPFMLLFSLIGLVGIAVAIAGFSIAAVGTVVWIVAAGRSLVWRRNGARRR